MTTVRLSGSVLLALAAALAGCEGNTNDNELAFFPVTRRVSLDSGEKEGNEISSAPRFSADGRYVVFASKSTNLDPDDADLQTDIFVRDLKSGETRLVSRATDGTKANRDCSHPDISGDGRYVVFASMADNLHPDDPDVIEDIFLRDLQTGTTFLVSRDLPLVPASGGDKQKSASPAISDDGRCVVFLYGNGLSGGSSMYDQVWLRDMQSLTSQLVSIPPPSSAVPFTWNCTDPAISADGRFVAFACNLESSPLMPYQVYVRDLDLGETMQASTASLGGNPNDHSGHPALSADGLFVAFESLASDLLAPGLDANGESDIFVCSVLTGEVVRVSNANAGTEAIGACTSPSISADGRYVAFVSEAANLVNGDTNGVADVFVRDTVGRTTVRASVRTYGGEANDASAAPSLAADGRFVAFSSVSTNLVEGDNNNTIDIFVRGPLN